MAVHRELTKVLRVLSDTRYISLINQVCSHLNSQNGEADTPPFHHAIAH